MFETDSTIVHYMSFTGVIISLFLFVNMMAGIEVSSGITGSGVEVVSTQSDQELTKSKIDWNHPPELLHGSMIAEIGTPAIIEPGQKFPELLIKAPTDGRIHAVVNLMASMKDENEMSARIFESKITNGEDLDITFDGHPKPGGYRLNVTVYGNEGERLQDSFYFTVIDPEKLPADQSLAVHFGQDGHLVYTPDYRGNRIPDFSYVGYKEGTVAIPEVENAITLAPENGDDTDRIQQAIDELSSYALDENGIRGAILLKRGVYRIDGTLQVKESGIVIKGEGQGDFKKLWLNPDEGHTLNGLKAHIEEKKATILIATGHETRRILDIGGEEGLKIERDSGIEIMDQYVPVGSHSFRLISDDHDLKIGDKIIIERSGNEDWISEIGMDQIPPRPDYEETGRAIIQWSPFKLQFENIVKAVDGDKIWVTYPVFSAIEQKWGGGRVYKFSDPGRISQVGVENLRAISFWKKNEYGVDDTRHPDRFLRFDKVINAWVKNVTVEHFYGTGGAFSLGRNSLSITMDSVSSLIADKNYYMGEGYDETGRYYDETGVYTGRYGWSLAGQNALIKNAYAINNRHAYAVNNRVAGPNVFLESTAEKSLTWSEPHHRWSVGGLYDNTYEDYGIALMNRLRYGSGHGWAGANYVAWNTSGGELVVEQPPTAQNWAIGHMGKKSDGPFHEWNMEIFDNSYGYWESLGQHVKPKSLYRQQLKNRLNSDLKDRYE